MTAFAYGDFFDEFARQTPTLTQSKSQPVLSGGDEPMFSFSRLPDQTDTWQRHRIQEQQAFLAARLAEVSCPREGIQDQGSGQRSS